VPAKLTDFPRPNVAVDLAVLTVRPTTDTSGGQLVTLVQQRTESPAGEVLPGRFIRERETIQQTVEALLGEKLGISPRAVTPRLLRVFDDPERDERGWVLSISHSVARPWEQVSEATGTWRAVDHHGDLTRTNLLFDHAEILRDAVADIRRRYEVEPDPGRILPGPFTLRDLRLLHQAVSGERLRKDTFNRRMSPQLEETEPSGHMPRVGRPAQFYVHPEHVVSPVTEALWRLPREE